FPERSVPCRPSRDRWLMLTSARAGQSVLLLAAARSGSAKPSPTLRRSRGAGPTKKPRSARLFCSRHLRAAGLFGVGFRCRFGGRLGGCGPGGADLFLAAGADVLADAGGLAFQSAQVI